jgi:outer membrane protein
MTSQLTLDSMKLLRAQNNKRYSLLLLKQLLNTEGEIQVEIPEITDLENREVTLSEWELSASPEYDLAQLNIDLETNRLKQAKSSLMPTVAINGSIGSGYSGNNTVLVGTEFLPKPFNVQMEENFYQSAVLTVNVPIFNRGRVRTNMKLAEAEIAKREIDREILYQQLVNQYEKLGYEIANEKVNVDALERSLTASEERFEASTEEYNAGALNVQDYLDLRSELFSLQADYYTSIITLRFKQEILGYMLE